MVEWECELSKYRPVLDLRDKQRASAAATGAPERDLPAVVTRLLEERPDVDEGAVWFLGAYRDLATCRPAGFDGAGPIPWTAIQSWISAHRADDDPILAHAVHLIIRAMDEAERAWHRAHPPPPKPQQPPPPARKR